MSLALLLESFHSLLEVLAQCYELRRHGARLGYLPKQHRVMQRPLVSAYTKNSCREKLVEEEE